MGGPLYGVMTGAPFGFGWAALSHQWGAPLVIVPLSVLLGCWRVNAMHRALHGRRDTPYEARASVAAGWHSDPSGRFHLRYWDGIAWTDDVFHNGVQTADRLRSSEPTFAPPIAGAAVSHHAPSEPWPKPGSAPIRPWYTQTVVIAVMLWFCSPVGLVLMWRQAAWHRGVKIGITAVFATLFVVGAIAGATPRN